MARPTKYQGDATIAKVYALAEFLEKNQEKFLEACGVEHVALALGVCTDTVYEWAKVHSEFSDALKTWTTTRNAVLYRLAKALPPAIWIFMTKNMLGWGDKQEIAHTGPEGAQAIRIEVVHLKGEGGNGGNGK
jgi:hypothetical protein